MRNSFSLGLVLALAAAVSVPAIAQETASPAPASTPTAAAPASAKPATSVAGFQDRYPRYKLRSGDQFDISFDLSPEFNQSAAVQPDGFISMRGVGDIHVAGQTVPELKETLRKAYAKILNDPIISVILKDFEKPYFVADGQLGKPGKYELRGDTTLTQAIAIAGGFLESAKHSQVLLFRRVSDQWTEAKVVDVKKMQRDGNLTEDPYLHPGDMLFVPKSAYSKFSRFIPTANVGTYLRPY
jgi:polysaccharide export outer membrane protein